MKKKKAIVTRQSFIIKYIFLLSIIIAYNLFLAGELPAYTPNGWIWSQYPYVYDNTSKVWYYFNEADCSKVTVWNYSASQWENLCVSTGKSYLLNTGWIWFQWPYAWTYNTGTWYYINETDCSKIKILNYTTSQWETLCKTTACSGDYTNSLGMTFKCIPAGTFTMGSPSEEKCRNWDETQHQVTISKSFYMQATLVTQSQWKAVMGSNPSYFKNCGDNCPVEEVSWNDVQSFITKLNAMGQGTYRLPTEAEWEYAARAGSVTAYYNGTNSECYCNKDDNLDKIAWYCYNSCVTYSGAYDCSSWGGQCKTCGTHPVAQKQSNSFGLYDMLGNVWQLCQDWYEDYPSSSVIDPTGPSSGSIRVVRGGSWGSLPYYSRSAARFYGTTDARGMLLGFRLTRQAN